MEQLLGYPVKQRTFAIAGREITLLGPANYDDLLDDPRVAERFARDEYLPYWAEFWPACLLLADAVAEIPVSNPGSAPPPTLLELGCGLGLVGLVALSRGWRTIVSDYDDDALAFVRASARLNGLPEPETRFVDWRERYDALCPDYLVGAEILYERRSLAPIAQFIARHLAPHGQAIVSDFNRRTADEFPEHARACGLEVIVRCVTRPGLKAGDVIEGRLFVMRHK